MLVSQSGVGEASGTQGGLQSQEVYLVASTRVGDFERVLVS